MATESSVDPGAIAELEARAAEMGYSLSQLLAASQTTPKKKRGRPKGSGIDDSAALEYMARLMVTNQAKSVHAAACMVAPRQLGQSESATIHRLMNKFKKSKAELMIKAKENTKTSLIESLSATRKDGNRYPRDDNKLLSSPARENLTSILSRICGEKPVELSGFGAQFIWASSINTHLPNQPISLAEAARDLRLQETVYRNIPISLFPVNFLDDHSVRAIEMILSWGVGPDSAYHLMKYYFPFISTEHPPAWFVEAFFVVARRTGIRDLMAEGLFLTRNHLIQNP